MKRMAIVGAGVAGLSAAVYARLNGYEADVFEAQPVSGGLCTAWRRGPFTFDGCVHFLSGSGPGGAFHPLWREVGVIDGCTFDDPVALRRFTDAGGTAFTLYADPDRLERHVAALAPGDAGAGRELAELVRACGRAHLPVDRPFELFGPLDLLRLVIRNFPIRRQLALCLRSTCGEFAARFRHPLLRAAIAHAIEPRASLMALVASLADMAAGSAGYPQGGSMALVRAIERRALDLGARIHCRAPVRRVTVRSGRAAGVELEDGTRVEADVVLSAADLRRTLDVLLEGRFPSPVHERLFELPVFEPLTQVSFGLARVFPEPERTVFQWVQPTRPVAFGGRTLEWVSWVNYGHDPTLAPPGKSVVTSLVETPHEWWRRLGRGTAAYQQAKAEVAGIVRAELDRALPGFDAAVEVVDVATPLTFERYTGSWRGSYMTWLDGSRRTQAIPRTVPGLDAFTMAGMWLMGPGGLPIALKTARDAVQLVCRRDRRPFVTATPDEPALSASRGSAQALRAST